MEQHFEMRNDRHCEVMSPNPLSLPRCVRSRPTMLQMHSNVQWIRIMYAGKQNIV